MSARRLYRLDVTYPEGSDAYDWEPPGWAPEYSPDPYSDDRFVWPTAKRLYTSKSGARTRARLLESYGATVRIVASEPVVWPEVST